MKTYAELDLIKIRDECGLDFARHTYSRGQCTCCYGPMDMSAHWWAKGKKPKKIQIGESSCQTYSTYKWDRDISNITYILFKNADNGRGHIKSLDQPIEDHTCIEYIFRDEEQKLKVCQMLQDQLGDEYEVKVPKSDLTCIIINYIGEE